MAQTEAEIIEEIKGEIENCGGEFSSWYVGIAADAEDRQFNDHSVDEENDEWIYCIATSS